VPIDLNLEAFMRPEIQIALHDAWGALKELPAEQRSDLLRALAILHSKQADPSERLRVVRDGACWCVSQRQCPHCRRSA
jgi:hypothetical protein